MARAVPEWRGKTDNSMPGKIASLRIWERCKGRCAHCDKKIMPGDKPARDHIVALADGGENVESNFQILCGQCHEAKTSAENTERAKVRSMKAKHVGLGKPSTFPGGRNSRFKRTMSGKVVDRQTGMEVGR